MPAGGAGLMSCVREGSIEPPYHPPHVDHARHGEGRTGRFLRGLRRMFKRRSSVPRTSDASPDPKSRSTSELLDAERHARKKEGVYGSGLSVSHDSVFTGERSGDESSDERPTPAHGPSHIVSSHRAELVAAVRRRGRGDGSDDDEDLGLPRSPPASPPTEKADKRHHTGISHSSCSDGSLLSVGSSEMDEDSSSGHVHDHSNRSDFSDLYNSSEPPSGVAPLSHSAARHKMAVRPRRTHGAPRRKNNTPIATSALPVTPELNEEMIRSTTPEVAFKASEVVTASLSSSTITKHHRVKEQHNQVNRELQRAIETTPNETKLKSSSLPPGLALSHLVGHSPAKLTIAEGNTPRSSIKRSQSSSQGKSLQDESPIPNNTSTSESHIHMATSREKLTSKQRSDNKYAEESCHTEKKSKSEKKAENEAIKSSKKEDSFFSRLLLRKSGKKTKKDSTDGETQDVKKNKAEKSTPQYKAYDIERPGGFSHGDYVQSPNKSTADRPSHKTAAQRVFANQMHKRLDKKGAYMQESMYKDVYSASKVPETDFKIPDLQIAEETDKMLNMDMKVSYRTEEEFSEKIHDRSKRTSSKDVINESHIRDTHNLHGHERSIRPLSNIPKVGEQFTSKAFMTHERAEHGREHLLSPALVNSEDESTTRVPRFRSINSDYSFHSGSMPKAIPYFHPNINISASASPPKSAFGHSSNHVKQFNRSTEHMLEYNKDRRVIDTSNCAELSQHNFQNLSKHDSQMNYVNSGLRSLGEEYVETRSSIGKSHSFRYASETNSLSSQESQMPSLPAIVGISEPLLESWEVNYRRSVAQNSGPFVNRNDYSQRVSARNYNINIDNNYDSLASTDSSSYMDSLKTESKSEIERKPLFTNNIQIKMENHKRDSDISQIEAKIDDIISSPKPLMATILKSSSLDSESFSPEKLIDDRRKTVSVESALSNSGKTINTTIVQSDAHKVDTDNFISITHLNKSQSTPLRSVDAPKIVNSEEKKKSSNAKPGVPEFLKIQLNKVDAKPITNIVLTANITPKKIDTPQSHIDMKEELLYDIENNEIKPLHNGQEEIQKQDNNNGTDIIISHTQSFDNCVIIKSLTEKNSNQQKTPQSPSTPKAFMKRKSVSVELQDKTEKSRTNSLSTEGSNEKIYDNISMDRKSHSSFGSKSSIQSTDSNEARPSDKLDDGVVYRKKPVLLSRELRSEKRNDDEPELMKVFARRSLKIKDTEADSLAQEIAQASCKEDLNDSVSGTKSKMLKNEFNASIKSRDSDKENEDTVTKDRNSEEKRFIDIAARVSQFGVPHYQRSVSITSVNVACNQQKRESAPACPKSEVNKYKKEVADSTPEKRLRNRTFPDPSNDREDIKNIAVKNDVLGYKADTLMKKPWQKMEDDMKKVPLRQLPVEVKDKNLVRNDNAVIGKDEEKGKQEDDKEKEIVEGEADDSPQFKGILHMRAEWERRAKQGMTK